MFRCCIPKKPIITNLKLTTAFTIQITEEDLIKLSIPHDPIGLPNNSGLYDCTFSQATYECDSIEELEKSFKALWNYLYSLYKLFPDKVHEMTYKIDVTGLAKNQPVSILFHNLDCFHQFLLTHELVAPKLLENDLRVSYRYRAAGSEDVKGEIPVNLKDYKQLGKQIQTKIDNEIRRSERAISESMKLRLKGRIGTAYINVSFDDYQSLEDFITSKLEENSNSVQFRPQCM
ncbi:MAG: hypothetical protein EPN84_08835 [Legionella sp.]|nr:MAG: hypothetical protein EPN84_08835 [Legionella sp.]